MVVECDCVPPAQLVLHAVQAVKASWAQSTGHACELQLLASSLWPQALPPYLLGLSMERERREMPEPHETGQAVQVAQALIAQSSGQASIPQVRISLPWPHALPPNAGWTVVARKRCAMPPPHVLEHVVQADQALSAQSTGHWWLLQNLLASSAGQGLPPKAENVVTERVRRVRPAPHESEHALQAA